MRTLGYIDGFNLYHGIKSAAKSGKWGKACYWLDVHALVWSLLAKDETLATTNYYTAFRGTPTKISLAPQDLMAWQASNQRQQIYVRALRENPNLHVTVHRFIERDPVTCRSCGHQRPRFEEKQTDVRIGVDLVADAALGRFDAAWVITADTDLVPALERVRTDWPTKRVSVAIPPGQMMHGELKRASHRCLKIKRSNLTASLLPQTITLTTGKTISCPPEWT